VVVLLALGAALVVVGLISQAISLGIARRRAREQRNQA
jgi:hypothetical protein